MAWLALLVRPGPSSTIENILRILIFHIDSLKIINLNVLYNNVITR